jgi:hypothetical protein
VRNTKSSHGQATQCGAEKSVSRRGACWTLACWHIRFSSPLGITILYLSRPICRTKLDYFSLPASPTN